jgi:hypothetical protein
MQVLAAAASREARAITTLRASTAEAREVGPAADSLVIPVVATEDIASWHSHRCDFRLGNGAFRRPGN